MIPATIDTVSVDLSCGDVGNRFRANGSTIKTPGFMSVYMEGKDDIVDDEEKLLPPLKEGQAVYLKAIRAEQHFTEPPPRYSEASLVKALEEFGIGRPSTYSSIICKDGTILERKSKRGKIFYSCSKYPTCDYALWNPPVAEPCPKCAWSILTLKTTKSKGTQKVCPQDGCGFIEDLE